MAKSNYSIIADVELNLDNVQKQLRGRDYKVTTTISGIDDVNKLDNSTKNLDNSTEDLTLTYEQFRQVMGSVLEVSGKMYEQVKNLNAVTIEYQKVSDLTGKSLENYVNQLSEVGKTVGRTGKPNRSEPGQWDGKPVSRTAPKPLKASRALSLQHKDEISLSVNVRNH